MSAPVALVVGHATLDRAGGELVPGGSVFYAAHALAALGAQVRVLTAAGPDLPADTFRFRAAPTATATATGSIDALVLAGDAGRVYAPRAGFVEVAAHDVPTTVEIEDAPVRRARVLRFEVGAGP